MFSTLLGLWSLFPLLGGLGAIGVALAAYFLGVGAVVQALSPLVKGFAEGVVTFVSTLWSGATKIFSDFSQVVFLGTVIVVSAWYFDDTRELRNCNSQVQSSKAELRKLKANRSPRYKTVQKVDQGWNPFEILGGNW